MDDVLDKFDFGNNGMRRKESTDAIQDLKPELNHKKIGESPGSECCA